MNTFLTKVSAWYTVVGLVQCIRYLAYLGVTTDHTIELYSSKGKTYTVKARKRRSVSRETKLRRIALVRWCAFVTICLIYGLGCWFQRYIFKILLQSKPICWLLMKDWLDRSLLNISSLAARFSNLPYVQSYTVIKNIQFKWVIFYEISVPKMACYKSSLANLWNLIGWFSRKSLKLLPPDVRF